jgi:hypothetical protein
MKVIRTASFDRRCAQRGADGKNEKKGGALKSNEKIPF